MPPPSAEGLSVPSDLDAALSRLREEVADSGEQRLRPAAAGTGIGDPPLVSVVVLNFNGEGVLSRCLDSLDRQTHPNYEIIVVDNASSDASLAILEAHLPSAKLTVVRSETNRGVPGGRNLGVLHAQGEIIAFIDNDGYARSDWLERLGAAFADETVGAAASLVFFARKKIVVNGAGGTLNLSGYGGDHCFRRSLEFSELPEDVLYPMGCGMALRRSLVPKVFPLDERIFNYFDDVEVGIRVWNAGQRVVLAADAWIDHDFSTSDAINQNKAYLCERNRVRTMVKYGPWRHFPRWLLHEWDLKRYFGIPGMRLLPMHAWLWNLVHLPSALWTRLRVRPDAGRYWGQIARTWAQYPPPLPEEHLNTARPDEVGREAEFGTENDTAHTLFGWFWVQEEEGESFRWGGREASLLLRARPSTPHLLLRFRVPDGDQNVRLLLRELGKSEAFAEFHIPPCEPQTWHEMRFFCAPPAGVCECLFVADPPYVDITGRNLGIGISRIAFVDE
jgi:N-acetylglucosaminyl-diphospho-decaprenol L-rhamnosyltransferase